MKAARSGGEAAGPGAGGHEDREVYIFAAGSHRAVSASPDTAVLPQLTTAWRCLGRVPLGVRHVELPGTEPEPAITALLARGFYVWRVSADDEGGL